jgi:hypothetical protein
MIPLHSLRITRRHRPSRATLPTAIAIIIPSSILTLVHRRGHGSGGAVALLSWTDGGLGDAPLDPVRILDDHVGYAAVLGILGELVVGLGMFGYDVCGVLVGWVFGGKGRRTPGV